MPVLKAEGKKFDVKVPVLIIGAGACGCTAALAAHERGVEVMILERDAKPRGNTSLSGGQIPAAGTKRQKAAGLLDDTPEILAQDLINKAHGECDLALARHIAAESAKTVDWLVDVYKMPLSCILDFRYPGHSKPHMHASPSRFGAELLTVFLQCVEAAGIPIATSAHVTDLYADAGRRIHGVRVTRPDGKTEDIGCDALILASNGYGGSKEMLAKYIPDIVNAHYHGHVGNQGDAVKWGEELGASIKDMGSFQGHGAVCTPHAIHLGWPSITEGGFQVNKHGKRFSNENAGYSEQALNVVRQPDHVAWTIWDERCQKVALQMHSHQEALKAGAIKRYDSAAEMAQVIGCDAAALAATLAAVAGKKQKDEFGRDFSTKPALTAPYYMAKIMGALFHTQGGLEVNTEARVLRRNGQSFPNLFAGGGAARGLSGPSDWGYLSGSGLLMATNLGRLAGEAAARQAGNKR
ncbi:MAG: FAD-dependent oxidoreductase [Alphaproteobacteria bacterium]|nr:FAD-dependent oxidoreductase [Alphaproteobacteria bacterium]